MSLFDHTEQTKIEYLNKYLQENKDLTFNEVLEKLKSESKLEWLLNLKVQDLFKFKEPKIIKKEFVQDKEDYEKQIISFLEENGVGESERGFSSMEILNSIGGNQNAIRKALNNLLEENLVFSTGETHGKKWVLYKFKKQASRKYGVQR